MRLLFICAGNTCRSPVAAALVAHYAAKAALRVTTDSAGSRVRTSGAPPTPAMLERMAARGIDMSVRGARALLRGELPTHDLVLALDATVRDDICALCPDGVCTRVALLTQAAGFSDPKSICDPWETGDYDTAFSQIDAAARALVRVLGQTQLSQ